MSRFQEVNDDGEPVNEDAYFVTFGEHEEGGDISEDDAFARFNGIIGRKSLLKVASVVDLGGSGAADGDEIQIPRVDGNTTANTGDSGEIAPAAAFANGKSGASSKNPFGSDPGAAATMAVARLIASSGGKGLPQGLVRLMSPYQAHYHEVRCLGKGGFGSVVSAVGRLDNRAVAVKKVHFKSAVPPWAKNDALEGLHEELLREARALALMDNPNVVKYHTAWIEPRWSKLAAVGATTNRKGHRVGAGATKASLSPGALARRDSFIVADDGGSDSDYSDEFSEETSDYSESGSITGGSARLLAGGGKDEKTGIGYSEVWTPAAAAGTLRWPYTLHIAMELCPSSTLRDWIRVRPRGEVQVGTASHIFRCVTEALRYVHAHGIIHRDVKPANILVHRGTSELEPTVKLMDFGLAVFYDFSAEKKSSERKKKGGATVVQVSLDGEDGAKGVPVDNVFSVGVGTASYCAPEQRRGTGLYTSAVDMYSLGVVLVEMFTALGQEATESERLHLIADAKGLNMPQEMVAKFPKHARLAERLLAVDPKERPSADEILRLWPRVNLRKGELPTTQVHFRSQGHDRTQMGAAVAAAAAAGAAAALSSSRAEVSSAAESAAVSAALDRLSIKRSMSLPEAELAAIADAVDAATDAVVGSGSPKRSPHRHKRAPSSLLSSPVLESDELVEESVGAVTSDESTSIDLERATRGDMAAEIRRLQERLAQLEGATR